MKIENENAVFPSFSSLLCSFGNNDVQLQMPNPDLSFPSSMHLPRPAFITERNVHWNESCMDSQACNIDHLGRFVPPPSINIPSILDFQFPGLFSAAATSSSSMEEIISQKRPSNVSAPRAHYGQVSVDHKMAATIEQNTKKRELKIGDGFHNNAAKRRKAQSEKHSVTHDEQMVPVKRNLKLGDRITALQKLVSPYGKTDTASVLHEAHVHIKLLQEQVQMLSAPYFRASLYHPQGFGVKEEDLRSKGLCLIPISCTQNLNTEDRTERSISKISNVPGNR